MSNSTNGISIANQGASQLSSETDFGNALSGVMSRKAAFGLTAAAALALAAGNVGTLNNYTQSAYTGNPQNCSSFNISSQNDPAEQTQFGGKAVDYGLGGGMNNFSTVYNTTGGQTQTALNDVIDADGGAWNKSSTMTRSGANGWTLNVKTSDGAHGGSTQSSTDSTADGDGYLIATINTGNGPQNVTNGEKLPDGSEITLSADGLTVTQTLKDGGTLTSSYVITYSAYGGAAYLNFYQNATGPAIVNGGGLGGAVAAAGGQAVLVMPSCGDAGKVDNNGGTRTWNPGGDAPIVPDNNAADATESS